MAISKSEPRIPPSTPQLPIPKTIGRYEVVDRLATGGMAEVFVCCDRGMAGLERLIVIKRILPHLAVHAQFVEMFLAEARYVARLNHPNVVQIHELGEDHDAPYLAMEYVPGSSVRDVLIAAIETGTETPAGAGIGLIAQACAGAHAAHELCDPQGKPLGLVHRDISPHNLMVTAEGHVKLLDFGIAKATEAASLEDHTRTGALKGKVHYMAPEQCKQEALDRRADIFALGIVGWELLAQERLFKRDSDLDSMQAIVTGDRKNLRKLRRDLPEGVIAALERSLRTNRGDRYATADEMRRALLDAADKAGLRTDIDTVGAFVKPLIGEVQQRRTSMLMSMAQERTQATPHGADDTTLVEKRQKPVETVLEQRPIEPTARTTAKRHDEETSGAQQEVPSSTHLARPKGRQRKRRLASLQAAAIAVVVLLLIGGGVLLRQRIAGPPPGTAIRMVFPPVADRELIVADVQPFQQYLQDVLDRPVTITVAKSYEDLLEIATTGRADIAVLPPNTYVRTRLKDPRIEILASKIIDGSTGSDGVIFVNETSSAKTIADLKGKRFCFADPLSTTGYVLPRIALRKAGIDPDKDIVSHISGTHTQVLRDIVDGVCEAGATYSGGFLAADRAGVPVARVHQLAITGRTPQDAICATATLSDADKRKIKTALFEFDPKKAGTIGGRVERITGFSHTTDRDYDSVRQAIAGNSSAAVPPKGRDRAGWAGGEGSPEGGPPAGALELVDAATPAERRGPGPPEGEASSPHQAARPVPSGC